MAWVAADILALDSWLLCQGGLTGLTSEGIVRSEPDSNEGVMLFSIEREAFRQWEVWIVSDQLQMHIAGQLELQINFGDLVHRIDENASDENGVRLSVHCGISIIIQKVIDN